ncbi:MAG: undecaprenyl-phosphate glucose phosphotransferase [Pseudomonadales bacterium]|nr:undecaprenyl-phosphate glucose phosphotransferase [Pseudomonadales bacterium]
MAVIFIGLLLATTIYRVPLTSGYLIAALLMCLIFSYVAEGMRLYRSWRAGRFSGMMITTWLSLTIAFTATILIAFVFKQSGEISRVAFSIWFFLCFLLTFIWRGIYRIYGKNRRAQGYNTRKAAIVGATKSGHKLLNQIETHDELGYEFTGFFEDRPQDRLNDELNCDIRGTIDAAIEKARDGEIDVLFIALPITAEQRIAEILIRLGDTTVDVHLIPDFFVSNLVHARLDQVGEVDTLSIFESPHFGVQKWIKRSEDVTLTIFILLIIAIPMLFISMGVRLTSRGPVLFKQRRYGLRGEEIIVWKFRTMTVMEDSCKIVQATKNDNRITLFGRFLRRTSLDELPQFFNVLKGDMSIVGPRPHAVAHNEEYRNKIEFYMLRHTVKPGITGWAQINGWRGETDTLDKMEKRIEYDLMYIKSWSLWFDLKIIFLTICREFWNKNVH